MGIPAFYRWLVERYPRTVMDVIEETEVAADTTEPNPNGMEFDNLYLDMNGIIHPCFHPEGLPAPETYEQVFKGVFKYIDKIFSVIRPRKLLYLAIDGVAPRAKMNQQRARRFRAAKDAADEASKAETARGVSEPGGEESLTKLDSNVITPGTKFMELLSSALQYYIHARMNTDPGWRGIKVILSDASVPGEGEHKIMSYIRLQRNLPGYDPNTRHCLYGLDADLIMLALATHEIHFSVLREDIRKSPPDDKSRKQGNKSSLQARLQKRGKSRQEGEYVKFLEDSISRQRFQFLNIWVLRDYLAHELQIPDPTVKVDLERLIDDFVFMCLFVGNDFLPHVPSLEISEGAIDLLLAVYKKEFTHMGGCLTNSFKVYLERVEHFIQAVGAHENAIFRKRSQARKDWEILVRRCSAKSSVKEENQKSTYQVNAVVDVTVDKVKLGEDGWRERYYTEKFEVHDDHEHERVQRNAVLKYVEGICWVMHYYYQGVCSWQWFYPYHYAPFASDFHGLNQLEINFTLGKPFKPFDQLMGVLPAASSQALPLFYRKLMTDPTSPILDFYPSDFELDMNGKRHAWQAVCKLPFIKEARLLLEIEKVEHTLTDDERRRNSLGLDILFVHISHPLAVKIFSFCKRNRDNPKLHLAKVKRKIDPNISGGMNGYMCISDKTVYPEEVHSPIDGTKPIRSNKVVSVLYKYPSSHPHIPKPPEGVVIPRKSVSKGEIRPPPKLWHEKTHIVGRRISERPIPPQSVSGPCLAKLAHRLVSQNCIAKQHDKMGGVSEKHSENCIVLQQDKMDVDGENLPIVGKRKLKKRRKTNQASSAAAMLDKMDGGIETQASATATATVLDKMDGSSQCQSENCIVKQHDRIDGGGENQPILGKRKKRRKMNQASSAATMLDKMDGYSHNQAPSAAIMLDNMHGCSENQGFSAPAMLDKMDGCSENQSENCLVKQNDKMNGGGENQSIGGKRKRKKKKRKMNQASSVTSMLDKMDGGSENQASSASTLLDKMDAASENQASSAATLLDRMDAASENQSQNCIVKQHVVTDGGGEVQSSIGRSKRKKRRKMKQASSATPVLDEMDGGNENQASSAAKMLDKMDGRSESQLENCVVKQHDKMDGDGENNL